MKKVEINFTAIVEDDQVKSEEEVKEEGYIDYEDAVSTGGIDEILRGSYEYYVGVHVLDEETLPGEDVSH